MYYTIYLLGRCKNQVYIVSIEEKQSNITEVDSVILNWRYSLDKQFNFTVQAEEDYATGYRLSGRTC